MRIIAGDKRGFALAAPNGDLTRPTLGRVRESVFSIIGAQIIDAYVIDLFAGAGTLGLEALSRGAAHCNFIENGRHALDSLSANIEKLGYAEQSSIIKQNVLTWLPSAQLPASAIIFCDPPYHQQLAQKSLELLQQNPSLAPGTMIVLQCGRRDVITPVPGPLALSRTEKYGETIVHFFL